MVTGVGYRRRARLAGRVQGAGQERGGSEAAGIFRVAETEIGRDLRRQVQALLQLCFPGYPSRSYFKLPPHFRYLAMAGGELAAQMGVELRVIRVGSNVLRTLLVSDLCDDGRLYTRNGWVSAANPCSWVKIHDHTTLGLATAQDTGSLMVKKTGHQSWPEGEVDLLSMAVRKSPCAAGSESPLVAG